MPGVVTGDIPLSTGFTFEGDERLLLDTKVEKGINPQSPCVDLDMIRAWMLAGLSLETVTVGPATDGQTSFTITGGYTPGRVCVYHNGVRLAAADYTASNGTTVVLNSPGAGAGDYITVDKVGTFLLPNAITLDEISALSSALILLETTAAWRAALGGVIGSAELLALGNYANDAAAAAGGVAVGGMYRNGSALMVRVS
jgi:hypothetical protein